MSQEHDLEGRKDAHIDLCLDEDVGSDQRTGLAGFSFEYDALPEIDLAEVDLSCTVAGKALKAPFVIGAMTGGTKRAGEINRRLAKAAERCGVGLALGSMRAMISKPELTRTFVVKDVAPDLPLLFGNIGAVQLNYGVTAAKIDEAMKAVGADVVNFHLNALQEAIQPEGDTDFSGLFDKMTDCIPKLSLPAFAKEVGAGIGARAAAKLAKLPLAGVETAGVGGTSWAKVESFRAPADSPQAEVGRRLAGFGVPTAQSIPICRKAMGDRTVVASGGLRSGKDVAVALALGADVGAMAKPLLEAANVSEEAAVLALETLIYELRVICFCVGAKNLDELRRTPLVAPGRAHALQAAP